MRRSAGLDPRGLAYKVRRIIERPGALAGYVQRVVRNRALKAQAANHFAYYGAVVEHMARTDPDRAIGSDSPESWDEVGRLQFDYLLQHGLRPSDMFLDLGCGNLRAGVHLIAYLDAGHYVGADLSPAVLQAGYRQLAARGLQGKVPRLYVVTGADLDFLPAAAFDIVHAHSVLSHLDAASACAVFRAVRQVLKPTGYFDFTFKEGREGSYLDEDFFYPRDVILAMVRREGFDATVMPDWVYPQPKVRARLRRVP